MYIGISHELTPEALADAFAGADDERQVRKFFRAFVEELFEVDEGAYEALTDIMQRHASGMGT